MNFYKNRSLWTDTNYKLIVYGFVGIIIPIGIMKKNPHDDRFASKVLYFLLENTEYTLFPCRDIFGNIFVR